MIEINLLPETLQKKKGRPLKLPRLPALPVALGLIGFLICVQLILVVAIQAKKAALNSLNKKTANIMASNSDAKALEDKLKALSAKNDVIDKLSVLKFNWAKKLNDLSDSVVSGIWLRSVYLKKTEPITQSLKIRTMFIIEGSSIVAGEGEPDSVGNFVNSLKENAAFSQDFDEIELTKVERRKIKLTEVMDFIITCHFKETKGL